LLVEAGIGSLKLDELLAEYIFHSSLPARLNETVKCKARVYILEGFNFAQRDLFSPSDPYLILRCGTSVFNEQKNYQLDTSDPKFYKCYEFNVNFPGAPLIYIEAYDYDDFFGDDLIGISKLDLDDRFFNKEWCALETKPVEYRDLFHTSSTVTQGVVKMWCEIHQMDSKTGSEEPLDLTPEPVKEYECRLVIWKTEEIEMMDAEGTSDVFVRAYVDPDDDHLTDTHWRCQDGNASFNWRLVFTIKTQSTTPYLLNIEAWDKDIIASNDLIGSFQLDIGPMFRDAELTDRTQVLNRKDWEGSAEEEGIKARLVKQGYADIDADTESSEQEKREARKKVDAQVADVEWEPEDKEKNPKQELFWVPVRRQDHDNEGKFIEGGRI